MATQATSYDRFEAAAELEVGARQRPRKEKADPYRLRPLPNESIYFYRKAIDNSRVVRQADPQARSRCWRWIATATASTMFLFALLWPNVCGLLAGYQIESLKVEQQRLFAEKAELEVAEARLLSPERLERMAQTQEFIDPTPEQVVFLHPKADGALALNVPAR
jgi:hypothetical protein